MYLSIFHRKGLSTIIEKTIVFSMMVDVARIPIYMKDTVSYRTGEWKYLKLSSFLINYSAN